ncbi:hypothetical protein LTR84_002161 [Exophiala bonariae]|uniref:Tim44-like domain-containing protein n=1 Tax=Exophiala bonariae TaxID=1690606 RepID=A0AAV9NAQ2_9EURO|nr:hypothetical protein LTR84_002161 [Exophiala bonariae]
MSQNALQISRGIFSNASYPLRTITSNHELCFQCSRKARSLQARHFSSTRPSHAALGEMRRAPSNAKQPSMKAKMALMDKKDVGNDLGRLPGTIILPQRLKDYPDGLKMKARVLWRKFKDSAIGLSSIIYASKWDVPKDKRTGKRKTRAMYMSDRLALAAHFHIRLNNGISTGNLKDLHAICADGLHNQCQKMIERQKELRLPEQPWKILRYSGIEYPSWMMKWPLSFFLPRAAVRVVSDRMTAVPFGTQSFIRECIVRIKSVQLLGTEGNVETLTEHVVLQQFILEGVAREWKIWGTIDPTKEELLETLNGKKGTRTNSFADEFRERVSSVTGAF